MPLPPPLVPRRSPLLRWFYLGLALIFLGLGIVGAFLPILPTTPFILLSAWAAARSSPRLLHWLEHRTAFCPMIRDWRRGGVVSRRAKWMSTSFVTTLGGPACCGATTRAGRPGQR